MNDDRRYAWMYVTPALASIALIAIFPLTWTFWESLHRHDLRLPWLGRPFVGLANYVELANDPRFWSAMAHTIFFAAVTVTLELIGGLVLALAMHRATRARALVRVSVLLPWAIPTVVAALIWRFLFDSQWGPVSPWLVRLGMTSEPIVWFAHARAAWVPIVVADVWKTAPFVALLLLAGLQNIPGELYEAAAVDGAGAAMQLRRITLPMLKPALLVALIFRTLDAFRVFDLIYVMTGGGPGTATEPIALLTFNAMFQNLRSGVAAALSVIVFAITFALAQLYIRALDVKEVG